MVKEYELIQDKDMQDKLISRVDVLEKVKQLFLIPGMEYATVKQLADFYEVEYKAIEKIYMRHKDELESDGMCLKSKEEFQKFLNRQDVGLEILEQTSYKMVISDGHDGEITVTNRGIKIFPKRAILRVGMLLRDSEVAKEVRTQLLNMEEKTPGEVKVEEIDKEQEILFRQLDAFNRGDLQGVIEASIEIKQYKDSRIKQLEKQNTSLTNENKLLTEEIIEWDYRETLNRGIRCLANRKKLTYEETWRIFYTMLKYDEHIYLAARRKKQKKKRLLDTVKDNEWPILMKQFAALCNAWGYSADDVINKVRVMR